jgi:hypothetical protein
MEKTSPPVAAIDMAFDGVGDADATDQQGGKPDQSEELGEAADGAFKLRRRIVTRADFPAGLRRRMSRIIDQRRHRAIVGRVVRQLYPVDPVHQAAGLQQPGSAQAGFADQEPRAEADPTGELVRLGTDYAANLKARIADGDAVADLEIEPRQQGRISRSAEGGPAVVLRRALLRRVLALGQQVGRRYRRIERQCAEHGIAAVHRLEFDQSEPAIAGAGHGAQRRRHRYLAARTQKRDFVRLGFALHQ